MTVALEGLSPLTQYLLKNPERIDRGLAETSLYEFVCQMWKYVDPAPFSDNWHLEMICDYLEAVSRGDIKRLIINIPPRCSKSTTVAVMWPAWTWIHQNADAPLMGPHVQFLTASYAQNLSTRDAVKSRRLIDSPLYQQRWGHRFEMTTDQNTKMRYENDRGGYRIATSVGGTLTGEGGDIILVDDAINSVDAESEVMRATAIEWWDQSMSTRVNQPKTGAMVVIMQRLHESDLTGHLLTKGTWEYLCLPMRYEHDHPFVCGHDIRERDRNLLWPGWYPEESIARYTNEDYMRNVDKSLLWRDRYPEAQLADLEADLGNYGSAGQLQQRPAPREGGMFQRGWWEIVDAAPAAGHTVRGWDLAASEESTAAWSVGLRMKWAEGFYYIEDVYRERGTPERVEAAIRSLAQQDGKYVTVDLPQDPGQAGKAQARYLVRQMPGYNVRYSPETGDKATRATALSAQTEAGNVKLVKGNWNHTFIEEAAVFPNSDFTDQIDAASRAFHRLVQLSRSRPAGLPRVG